MGHNLFCACESVYIKKCCVPALAPFKLSESAVTGEYKDLPNCSNWNKKQRERTLLSRKKLCNGNQFRVQSCNFIQMLTKWQSILGCAHSHTNGDYGTDWLLAQRIGISKQPSEHSRFGTGDGEWSQAKKNKMKKYLAAKKLWRRVHIMNKTEKMNDLVLHIKLTRVDSTWGKAHMTTVSFVRCFLLLICYFIFLRFPIQKFS